VGFNALFDHPIFLKRESCGEDATRHAPPKTGCLENGQEVARK